MKPRTEAAKPQGGDKMRLTERQLRKVIRRCISESYDRGDHELRRSADADDLMASLRGADVRLLLPAKGDVPIVAAAARSYYPELLEAGVRIFEFGPPVLHAKTLVVDGQLGVVGTANCDNRSFRLNFEVVVAMYDATLVLPLANQFEVDLEAATEVTLEALQSVSLPRRLGSSAARLLSPIL